MLTDRFKYDPTVIVGATLVFGLPLTLLFPSFSVWDVVPKVRVERLHFIEQDLTWSQSNTTLVTILALFFCLFLEMRKRKLDAMVDKVLMLSQAADATMEVEQSRQAAAVRVCLQLLDASTEHYENLVVLRDELRKRDKLNFQAPPVIELSSSVI
ncbi:unnamed protein product [Arctia plantaginis]|uniref:Uncharacterized protein n=1 Tax=Arctia plantaginis TaxID=874455 RepID=A0A8S0ZE26_ARCPL|nr:unnamed protein product [Arctia plantaginis]